jgi:hypothetical protein
VLGLRLLALFLGRLCRGFVLVSPGAKTVGVGWTGRTTLAPAWLRIGRRGPRIALACVGHREAPAISTANAASSLVRAVDVSF